MSWARIDDQLAFHPKMVQAGNEAVGAWIRMLALSCAQLTNGEITDAVAATITNKRTLERLVTCRLLDRIEGGYVIHDFLDWNPDANVVKAKREADRIRKACGRDAQVRTPSGQMSGRNPRGQSPDSERNPSGVQPDSARCPPVPSPVSRLPSPVPISFSQISSATRVPSAGGTK